MTSIKSPLSDAKGLKTAIELALLKIQKKCVFLKLVNAVYEIWTFYRGKGGRSGLPRARSFCHFQRHIRVAAQQEQSWGRGGRRAESH